MDLNKVMIIGRSTSNLEVKTIEWTGTSVANFTVATNRKFKNKEWNVLEDAEYHRCVSYGKWAEILWQYLIKGKRVYIEWRLRTRRREDNEGATKYSTEIIVDNFIFLDAKSSTTESENTNPEDEELPF